MKLSTVPWHCHKLNHPKRVLGGAFDSVRVGVFVYFFLFKCEKCCFIQGGFVFGLIKHLRDHNSDLLPFLPPFVVSQTPFFLKIYSVGEASSPPAPTLTTPLVKCNIKTRSTLKLHVYKQGWVWDWTFIIIQGSGTALPFQSCFANIGIALSVPFMVVFGAIRYTFQGSNSFAFMSK